MNPPGSATVSPIKILHCRVVGYMQEQQYILQFVVNTEPQYGIAIRVINFEDLIFCGIKSN